MDMPAGRFATLMDPQGAVFSVIALKTAPCGSIRVAKRPAGMSIGPTSALPPAAVAAAAVASGSLTANQTCQWFGTPSICGGVAPPAMSSPTNSIVYSPSPIGTLRALSPTTSS